MKKVDNIWRILVCAFLLASSTVLIGQNQSILDFTVKKLNGDTIELRKKLDPHTNYIIETMAFWCKPCVRSIDRFNYHKNYWKDRYNVEILLIEDEHWDDLSYVEAKMEENEWDLECVVSNGQFGTVGINSIPRYYFKGSASDTVERVYGNIEKFFLERVDSIKFSPILDQGFKQGMLKNNCEVLHIDIHTPLIDTVINEVSYYMINGIPFRESGQNGNIIRYDQDENREEIYVKYSAPLCSKVWLKDLDGDSLAVKILDRYQVDSVLHLATDQMIYNECTGEDIPFEFIQNVGSNAGFFFDISEEKIISRLICHEKDGESIYTDEALGDVCGSLSVLNPIKPITAKLFPNPVNSNLIVELNFSGEKKIEIYSLNGEKLTSVNTYNNKIEISLPSDINTTLLLVRISSAFGVLSKKVIRISD